MPDPAPNPAAVAMLALADAVSEGRRDDVRIIRQWLHGVKDGTVDPKGWLEEEEPEYDVTEAFAFSADSKRFFKPENYDKIEELPNGRELWAGANDWECGWTWAWLQPKGMKNDGEEPEAFLRVDHSKCPGCHGDPDEMHSKGEKECIKFAKDKVEEWAKKQGEKKHFSDTFADPPPGTVPPHPGLVFDKQIHHWVRKDTGEATHDHTGKAVTPGRSPVGAPSLPQADPKIVAELKKFIKPQDFKIASEGYDAAEIASDLKVHPNEVKKALKALEAEAKGGSFPPPPPPEIPKPDLSKPQPGEKEAPPLKPASPTSGSSPSATATPAEVMEKVKSIVPPHSYREATGYDHDELARDLGLKPQDVLQALEELEQSPEARSAVEKQKREAAERKTQADKATKENSASRDILRKGAYRESILPDVPFPKVRTPEEFMKALTDVDSFIDPENVKVAEGTTPEQMQTFGKALVAAHKAGFRWPSGIVLGPPPKDEGSLTGAIRSAEGGYGSSGTGSLAALQGSNQYGYTLYVPPAALDPEQAAVDYATGRTSTPDPNHKLMHELAHYQHARFGKANLDESPEAYQLHKKYRDKIRDEVGGQATMSPSELVPEVFAGIKTGATYSPEVMEVYKAAGGPSVSSVGAKGSYPQIPVSQREAAIRQRAEGAKSFSATFASSPPFPGAVLKEVRPGIHRWTKPHSSEHHATLPHGHLPIPLAHATHHEHLTPDVVHSIHDSGDRIAREVAEANPESAGKPGVLGKLHDLAIGGLARLNLFLLKHHDKIQAVGSILDAALDTPGDMKRFGYNPAVSGGTATGEANKSIDPMQVLTRSIDPDAGVSSHLAATIASYVLPRAWKLAKHLGNGLKKAQGFAAGSATIDDATDLMVEMFEELNATYGLEGGIDRDRIHSVLSGGSEFADSLPENAHEFFGMDAATFADHHGLVQKEVDVHRVGKTIKQKRWVKPTEAPKGKPTAKKEEPPAKDVSKPAEGEKATAGATEKKTKPSFDSLPPVEPIEKIAERFKKSSTGKTLIDADVQRWCEEGNESRIASHVGGKNLPDCEPMDVQIPPPPAEVKHGIESKTMVSNTHGQIHMGTEAKQRKRAWRRKNKAPVHTVVTDDREVYNAFGPGKHDLSKRKVYYRRGFGSFKVEGMYEVPGGYAGLQELIDTPTRKLPPGAWKPKKKEKIQKREGDTQSTVPEAGGTVATNPVDPEHVKMAEGWVSASADIPESLQKRYTDTMASALSAMPDGCRKLALNAIEYKGSVNFHPDLKTLNAKASSITGKKERGIQGFVHKRHLHVDNDKDARGTYLHELGHLVDDGHVFSGDARWLAAYKKEVTNAKGSMPLLSTYARESSQEGFAELHRIMIERGIDATEKKFPLMMKFMRERGLLT